MSKNLFDNDSIVNVSYVNTWKVNLVLYIANYRIAVMARLLQIAQLGHPVLRNKAKTVKDIHNLRLRTQELINDMIATVVEVVGVGIAAPQVYEPYRLFIIASRPNPIYPDTPEMEPTPIINPRIISNSEEIIKFWEGCLSVPDLRGLVPRYRTIQVEYFNLQGDKHSEELTDFVSIIFQHELDHLDGIVYLDRVASTRDIITEKEYQRMLRVEKHLLSAQSSQ